MIEQLRNTYNKTADQLNNTSPEVAKVTWAWDHVQSKVGHRCFWSTIDTHQWRVLNVFYYHWFVITGLQQLPIVT